MFVRQKDLAPPAFYANKPVLRLPRPAVFCQKIVLLDFLNRLRQLGQKWAKTGQTSVLFDFFKEPLELNKTE